MNVDGDDVAGDYPPSPSLPVYSTPSLSLYTLLCLSQYCVYVTICACMCGCVCFDPDSESYLSFCDFHSDT
jgi:hypothetical protein